MRSSTAASGVRWVRAVAQSVTRTMRSAAARRGAAAVLLAASCLTGARAQDRTDTRSGAKPAPTTAARSAYRLIKHFDFDERAAGNFEDTPMHWRKLAGDGMPAYSRGVIDEQVGHDAAPSFRLDLAMGNLAYEYAYTDLNVLPNAAYRIVAAVRTTGLTHSRAFLAVHLVNREGGRIAGSDAISPLVSDADMPPEGWRRLTVDLIGQFPDAAAIRLQLWVLQTNVWREVDPNMIDPIQREDVGARAWFDDIRVFVFPHTRMRFSAPSGIVQPGEPAALLLEIKNAAGALLPADLTIVNQSGGEVFRHRITAIGVEPTRLPLPPLPPGYYVAQLSPQVEFDTPLVRTLRFVVAPPLPAATPLARDMGIDASRYEADHPAALREIVASLNAVALKVGVPLMHETGDSSLVRAQIVGAISSELTLARAETIGVLLPPPPESAAVIVDKTLHGMLTVHADWVDHLAPVLAQLGGRITSWQLGRERDELAEGAGWTADRIALFRTEITRFTSLPELVVPVSVFSPQPPEIGTPSFWVEPTIPARRTPAYLDFLVEPAEGARWVSVPADDRALVDEASRTIDLIQRIILAKALSPDRLFVEAPIARRAEIDGGEWEPTPLFIPLRTLFVYLSGKRAVAVNPLPPDGLIIFFHDESSGTSCAAAWCWTADAAERLHKVYLGAGVTQIDLWGRRTTPEVVEGRTHLRLGRTPVLLENLDLGVTLLAASLRVDPTYLQLHSDGQRPILTFRNGAATPIRGEVAVSAPAEWQVSPQKIPFDLAAGEELSQPLTLTLPRRVIRADGDLEVRVDVQAPSAATLHFTVPLQVGFRDIDMLADVEWHGDDLVVRQALKNLSAEEVRFDGFCQPVQRPRQEHAYLNLPPGETAEHSYVFPSARDLAGLRIHVGVREIRGNRVIERLVTVPP